LVVSLWTDPSPVKAELDACSSMAVYPSLVTASTHVVSFGREHVPDAAALFVASFNALREDVSALSDTFADTARVAERLENMSGFAALDDGGWWGI
jgi:hypothetical protein